MVVDGSFVFAGALTGFLLGLTGVGGGAIMTPMLLIFFHINPSIAIATDLWFAVITKIAGAIIHYQAGQIDWQVVKRLWSGSIPVAVITGFFLYMGGHITKISWLTEAVAVIVIITALGILFAPQLLKMARKKRLTHPQRFKATQPALTVLLGAVVGLCVTLTSVGAGTIGSVILLYLYPLRMKPQRLVATDLTHAIPLAIVAGLSYLLAGAVNFNLLFNLLIGSLPAVILGSLVTRKIRGRKLQLILAIVLFLAGVKLLS